MADKYAKGAADAGNLQAVGEAIMDEIIGGEGDGLASIGRDVGTSRRR